MVLLRDTAQLGPAAISLPVVFVLADEAESRGYHFDTAKIACRRFTGKIAETRGQLDYKWEWLQAKLRPRAPDVARKWQAITRPESHPLFRIVPGKVRDWKKRW